MNFFRTTDTTDTTDTTIWKPGFNFRFLEDGLGNNEGRTACGQDFKSTSDGLSGSIKEKEKI